jgi:hypothetical protein
MKIANTMRYITAAPLTLAFAIGLVKGDFVPNEDEALVIIQYNDQFYTAAP